MAKKNVIKDYKSMTPELMALLVKKYPDGFEDETIFFTNAKGERVEAVQLETEDTKYLIKMSASLVSNFESFDEEDEDFDSDDASDLPEADLED
ncbi:MAG: hypothetical protein RL754_819 [Bacteroidota bacterium]